MDGSTITSASFTLTNNPTNTTVAAGVGYDSSSLKATLTPTAALANNTSYTAKLDSTVKAGDGTALASAYSWSLTTNAAPPAESADLAASSAIKIATGVAPTASFSRAMDASTISSTSFTLTNNATNTTVAAGVGCNSPCTTATLTPSSALAGGTSYTAKLDSTVKAGDGAALASAYSWS